MDKILLAAIKGALTEPDLIKLAGFINVSASKLSVVVIDAQGAQVEPEVSSTLFKLKSQYEKNRMKFLIVTPEIIGADYARVTDALSSLKTPEAERISEILAKEAELAQIEGAVSQARAALAAAVGKPEAIAEDELSQAFLALEEKNGQLLRLFKTLSSEINALQAEGVDATPPGADNPGAVAVSETKRRALDMVRASKLLD